MSFTYVLVDFFALVLLVGPSILRVSLECVLSAGAFEFHRVLLLSVIVRCSFVVRL